MGRWTGNGNRPHARAEQAGYHGPMDLFGHVAASFLVGRAASSDPAHRRGTTAAALIAGLVPDVDAATYLVSADLFRRVHQIWTHNLVALALLPGAIGLGIARIAGIPRGPAILAAYGAMALHLLGDLIGLWPVPLFQPFSDHRVAWFLLPQDFCWSLDAILVGGAALTLWDPVAEGCWRVRGVLAVTLAAAGAWLVWV